MSETIVDFPAPEAPTIATVSPGAMSSERPVRTSRSGSAPGMACCSMVATAEAAAAGYRNRTESKVTLPEQSTRSMAPGRSVIGSGASSTSKTRSKDTIEVMRSTRAFVRPVRG